MPMLLPPYKHHHNTIFLDLENIQSKMSTTNRARVPWAWILELGPSVDIGASFELPQKHSIPHSSPMCVAPPILEKNV